MRGVENVGVGGDGGHGGGRGGGEGRMGDVVVHVEGGDRTCRRTPHWLVGSRLIDGVPAAR